MEHVLEITITSSSYETVKKTVHTGKDMFGSLVALRGSTQVQQRCILSATVSSYVDVVLVTSMKAIWLCNLSVNIVHP